jgi:hypothetical protein
MIYVTIRCPHCGAVVDKRTNPRLTVGNPFETCWCKMPFINSYKKEWINMTAFEQFKCSCDTKTIEESKRRTQNAEYVSLLEHAGFNFDAVDKNNLKTKEFFFNGASNGSKCFLCGYPLESPENKSGMIKTCPHCGAVNRSKQLNDYDLKKIDEWDRNNNLFLIVGAFGLVLGIMTFFPVLIFSGFNNAKCWLVIGGIGLFLTIIGLIIKSYRNKKSNAKTKISKPDNTKEQISKNTIDVAHDSSTDDDIKSQLEILKDLYDSKLITEEEYLKNKTQVINKKFNLNT